jgi:trans-2,3-dihydro-3-hydroxyanthranilate isomerase
MMEFDFDWVDAFSAVPFGGNGCSVVHGGATLDAETCMAYVRETSLVECTFTGPSDKADLRVRYFLASREIPFAGHPTIATVAALRHRGMIGGGRMTLETGAGVIPVEVEGDMITMTQAAPTFGATVPPAIIAAAGGIGVDRIVGTPRLVSTGLPFCIAVLDSLDTIRSLKLDLAGLRAMMDHLGKPGTDMMEPFWVTRAGATPEGDTFSRLLLTRPSPPEDPFTGSATGAMAACLWSEGLIDSPRFVAEQGHGLGRPGRAEVEVLGPRDAITGVRVGGQGCLVMSGKVYLPG